MKNLLLALLSAGLIGTWVYHLYDKAHYSQRRTEVYIKDSIAVAEGVKDSLQRLYSYTIKELDTKLDSSRSNAASLKSKLDNKLDEIYKLKGEIDGILKNRSSSKKDLELAQEKITELQELVAGLRSENSSMEVEKQRLNNIMSQLNGEITGLQENMKRLDDENKVLTEKVNMASVFVASELNLAPITIKNNKEQETNQVRKVSKLVISFNVQNNINQYNNADVYIVITQPDGSILKNDDVWEASSKLELRSGAKIPFTRKVRFEYLKGESKNLVFSINADEYYKGAYTLQVYHNGFMIGQVTKTLV